MSKPPGTLDLQTTCNAKGECPHSATIVLRSWRRCCQRRGRHYRRRCKLRGGGVWTHPSVGLASRMSRSGGICAGILPSRQGLAVGVGPLENSLELKEVLVCCWQVKILLRAFQRSCDTGWEGCYYCRLNASRSLWTVCYLASRKRAQSFFAPLGKCDTSAKVYKTGLPPCTPPHSPIR